MSFDTEFNYTFITNHLNLQIQNANIAIGLIDTALENVGNLQGNVLYLKTPGQDHYNSQKDEHISNRTMYQDILTEVGNVTSLDGNSKTTLYEFFQKSRDTHYLTRMLYNTTAIIAHASNIFSEQTLSNNEQYYATQIVCNLTPLNANVHSVLGGFF